MALIDLNAEEFGAGMSHGSAIRDAAKEIAELTGNRRSTYDLKKDRERDEQALRDMVDRPPRLEDL